MQTNSNFVTLNKLDKAGIFCSGACAVHCLLVPILVYTMPSFTSFLDNELIHIGILLALLPISVIAFTQSYKHHKKSKPLYLGIAGLVILFSAIALEALHIEVPYLEKILTGVGSAILIVGHILNIKEKVLMKNG